jgi:hypothetical protein
MSKGQGSKNPKEKNKNIFKNLLTNIKKYVIIDM